MEDFLIQFSTLPKKFIKDFYVIAKEEYSGSDIVIDFIVVCEWLKTRKDHLKKILVDNFDEDYDYTIKKVKVKQKNGNGLSTRHDIKVSSNCFKELCMLSQTPKAKEVRKYFIEMEKLVNKYYLSIKKDMYKQIGVLKDNQKGKINIKGGVIYILEAQNSQVTLYKLGKTKNLKKRLQTYNTGNANDVKPIFIMKVSDIDSVESCIKNACSKFKYRKYKEVYEIDIDVLKKIINKCDELIRLTERYNKIKSRGKMKDNIKKMKLRENKYFIYVDK